MRVVIYEPENYEPITVIEVPLRYMREIESGARSRELSFPAFPDLTVVMGPTTDLTFNYKIVRLSFEPIYKGRGRLMWLCTANDPESALLLRAAFLPGQHGEVNRQIQGSFLRGLITAMT